MDPARLLPAVPDVALGLTLLVTWFAPFAMGPSTLSHAALLMVLEFIVIHSSAFMGLALFGDVGALHKTATVVGLGLFYSIFLVAFAYTQDQWWPVWAFSGLTANRLLNALFFKGSADAARRRMQQQWATSALLYVLWVIATAIVPLPAFGLTVDFVRESGIKGAGLWVHHPESLMVARAGYFLSQAYYELTGKGLSTSA
jgi:hypothetical protein